MGIDAQCLVILSKYTTVTPLGKCLTLGRQNLYIQPHLISWASQMTGVPINELMNYNGQFAEDILLKYFGAVEITSLDAFPNDSPSILYDLNQPIPPQMFAQYDSVLDIGTSEHIFSTSIVFQNIKKACKPGGFIFHYVPGNNMCGHGLYQFSPTLFQSLYRKEINCGDGDILVNFQKNEKCFYRLIFNEKERINISFGGRMNQFVGITNASDIQSSSSVQQLD